MLGDGFGTLEPLPAFFATVLVGWHGVTPQGRTRGSRDANQTAALGAQAKMQPRQSARATRRDGNDWLHDERIVPLRVVHCDTRARRQLQHGSALTFAQMRQQDDFSVGKLKGVMMNV
jgi:hypothetical protein